jgi:hypothetical protein
MLATLSISTLCKNPKVELTSTLTKSYALPSITEFYQQSTVPLLDEYTKNLTRLERQTLRKYVMLEASLDTNMGEHHPPVGHFTVLNLVTETDV